MDPNHMVTVGSEGTWGGVFKSMHASPLMDYTTCHIWAENWGIYTATDSSTVNLQAAVDFALDYLDTHNRQAVTLGKPLVLEEFGLARDAWAPIGGYDPATPVIYRYPSERRRVFIWGPGPALSRAGRRARARRFRWLPVLGQ